MNKEENRNWAIGVNLFIVENKKESLLKN